MTQFYRIDGNLAQLIEERVIHSAPTDQLLPLLSRDRDTFLTNMPNGIRHVFYGGDNETLAIVIEQQPTTRTIHLNDWNQTRRHRIAIPWIYFVFTAVKIPGPRGSFRLEDWRVYCSPERVTRYDQSLYALPVNNVYDNGGICFGTAAAPPGANLGEHIDNLVSAFWNSQFNMDVRPRLPYDSYETWDQATQDNQLAWMNWDWRRLNNTPARRHRPGTRSASRRNLRTHQ
jgi:hypothetical protein